MSLSQIPSLPVPGTPEGIAVLKETINTVRDDIRDRFCAGELEARDVCDGLTSLFDEVIRQTWRMLLDRIARPPRQIALVALGGYGRRAMFPYSDIDLQILSHKKERELAGELTERLLYVLWDLGLKVGYATRTPDETLSLIRDDITVATAVLDSRLITGDETLYNRMERRLFSKYYAKQHGPLIRALLEDRERRHNRYGETIYRLEPNVKFGQGGMRDFQFAVWSVKVRYHVHSFSELVRLGVIRRGQLDELLEARRFLWKVRHALHFLSNRKNDQLTFAYQEQIAEQFGFEKQQNLAVEQFMQSYYRHTKTVKNRSSLLVERCLSGGISEKLRGSRRKIDDSFRLYAGKVTVIDPKLFENDPGKLVAIFRVAQSEGRDLYPFAKELVVRSLGLIDDKVRSDPEVARTFKEILCSNEDDGSVLMQMHELGVLNAYLPEFEKITGKTHHDVYHIYTVDIHTIKAVMKLKAIARGELENQWPVATRLFQDISNATSLYLAVLLHDVGKGYGPGHSEQGAKLVETIARRLHLTRLEEDAVRFLIRRHLLMAHTVEKHDLNDVVLLRRFAREVGNPDLLKKLYILTMCDMSTTGPQLSASWRDTLLQELYHKADMLLTSGLDLWNDPSKETYRKKEDVINLMFSEHPGENYRALKPIEDFFGMLPTRYFRASSAEMIVKHISMAERLQTEPVVVDFDRVAGSRIVQVTVGCQDRPGVLSKISGVMAAWGLDILDAQINSLENGLVLDVFRVQDPHERTLSNPKRRVECIADLTLVLTDALSAETLLESRRPATTLGRAFAPSVVSQVVLDNDTSQDYTLIEVHAMDRIGVLYRITHALFELQLEIHLAKISSKGHKVLDVFYVQTVTGQKVTERPHIDRIRKTIFQALADNPPEPVF